MTQVKGGGRFPLAFVLLWGISGFFLFFLQLVVPTTYDLITAIFLALALWFAGIAMVWTGKTGLHRSVAGWFHLFFAVGSFYVFYGVLRGNPGALESAKVFVLYPIFYMFLISGIRTPGVLKWIHRVLVAAAIFVAVYSFSYIFHSLGFWPDTLYFQLNQGQAIGFYHGYMEFRLYAISSLLFLAPYLLTLVIQGHFKEIGLRRGWVWLAFLLVVSISFLTGRRALIFIVILSPILVLIFSHFFPHQQKAWLRHRWIAVLLGTVLLGTIAIFGIVLFSHWNIQDFWHMLLEGFDFKHAPSAHARAVQFFGLLQGWSKHPLLGTGLGAGLKGIVRSKKMPWAFELGYVAFLYHVGLIGVILYGTGIGWIYWNALRIFRLTSSLSWHMLPILVGTTSSLIGNATNPYLEKFAYLWVIFLPIAVINLWLLGLGERGKERPTKGSRGHCE